MICTHTSREASGEVRGNFIITDLAYDLTMYGYLIGWYVCFTLSHVDTLLVQVNESTWFVTTYVATS